MMSMATSSNIGSNMSTTNKSNGVSDSNVRFEDELYTTYLQARSSNMAISSTGLLEWAQEIAVAEAYYDRDEARLALTPEWLDGWCQRYNVNDVDAEYDDDDDIQVKTENAEDEEEDEVHDSTSMVLYPPTIDSPLTPSPPQAAKRTSNKQRLANSKVEQASTGDIESVVATYNSTPQPRSRLFEHMLADAAGRMVIKFMQDVLGMGDDARPEQVAPEELNRILIQFFRQLHRPDTDDEPYSVKVLHGILEGLARYLRGCGYSCDLAYESNFSDARAAFGEKLLKSFEIESKQRHIASSDEVVEDISDVTDSEVIQKMVDEHHLRPLGADEIAPDTAMASFNKNTQKVMTWAAKNVMAFGRERLNLTQFSRVEDMPPELLNIVLTRFFCEARKADGTEFGWNSFKSVFSNLEAYLRVHRYPLGLHDPIFRMAKQTLFNVLRPNSGSVNVSAGANNANATATNHANSSSNNNLSTPANLTTSNHHSANNQNRLSTTINAGGANSLTAGAADSTAGPTTARPLYHRPIEINSTEENTLWAKGAFGWHSPQAINTTLYYYMRHIYGVRSGESHRRINFGDLRTMRSDDGREEFLVYTKAAAGVDMNRLRRMWATRDDRCIVKVFKVMVAKRPPETRKPDAPLYLQPKRQRHYILDNQSLDGRSSAEESSGTDYWFTTAPLGKNALATLMREAYQTCGLDASRFNTAPNGNGLANGNRQQNVNRTSDESYLDDDIDNLLADTSSNMGDDGGSTRSSSSFSQNGPPVQPAVSRLSQNLSTANSTVASRLPQATRKSVPSSYGNNINSQAQSQALDLASSNNRKRDNMGRFTGTGATSGNGYQNQHEALSLCKNSSNNSNNRSSTTSTPSRVQIAAAGADLSMRPKFAKMETKGEPKAGDATLSATSTAFGNGVGNMSISMQPKNANDMADVMNFLNQFLNSLNNNSSSSTSSSSPGVYKCTINVTVNISK